MKSRALLKYLLLGVTSICLISLGALAGVIYSAKLIADSKSKAASHDEIKRESTLNVSKAVARKESLTDDGSLNVISHVRLASIPVAASRQPVDSSGFSLTIPRRSWSPSASLQDIRQQWISNSEALVSEIEFAKKKVQPGTPEEISVLASEASYLLSIGDAEQAYNVIHLLRSSVEAAGPEAMESLLSTAVYFQGIAALRLGENENCVMCRGDSACILPIRETAVHKKERGSRMAIDHFTEYLEAFPQDIEVKWLLNLAHMTLGEYPDKVNPLFLINLDGFRNAKVPFPVFEDIAEKAGVNRFDQAGGAIVDDFNNDGLLDIIETTWDHKESMAIYQNQGDSTFKDVTASSNVAEQFGGLQCMQTDFNNDGLLDVFIPRGAWIPHAVRPTLLQNRGSFQFEDVTQQAGLLEALNSNSAQWADFDNDGWLDLFICCERQSHRLYKNLGNGKFADVSRAAGLAQGDPKFGKGCTWIDYDNDHDSDLFINYLDYPSQLYQNNGDGTFTEVSQAMGIDGPHCGFSCWCWDFNNDGWLDIFATSYSRTVEDIVKGLIGVPHSLDSNRLYLNEGGKRFKDITKEAGLDLIFATMGSNFCDFDNDGFLDFYLGTGEPALSTLVPNRMFKNVNGSHFVEVTSAANVGHLQKGHAISCGDIDRDGDADIFAQMGGAVDGDRFRNILFKNPGNGRRSVTVKLVGSKSNHAAIGARIKIVTSGDSSQTIYRHVTSGSSFGANTLEQLVGIGDHTAIERIEVTWPTTGVTQVFSDVPLDTRIEIHEDSDELTTIQDNMTADPANG